MRNQLDEEEILPHIPLSREESEAALAVMRAGNPLFRSWSLVYYGKRNKGKLFRESLFKGLLDTGRIPDEDLRAMFAVRDIEEKVLFGHIKLVRKVANLVFRRIGAATYQTTGDLVFEGLITLRDVIYSFGSNPGCEEAVFLNYAWDAILKKLYRSVGATRKSGGTELVELVAESREHQPLDQVILLEECARQEARLEAALVDADLTPLERDLFLTQDVPGSQSAIARRAGVTRARTWQVLQRAKEKMGGVPAKKPSPTEPTRRGQASCDDAGLGAFVDRLVAGESRRKLVAELHGLGYKISLTSFYYLGVKRKQELARLKVGEAA